MATASPAPAEEISPVKAHITHVVFDMDGLLIDTEPFYTEVQERILARFGKTFDWSLKAKMMGKKAIESAHIFVEECGLTSLLTPEEFLQEREGMLEELFPTCQLLPGVQRLVGHLQAHGIPMCVATGSHKRHFELKTKNHGEIFSKMHHVVMGDDPEVKKGKPSPDIFLAAAKRFEGSMDPSNILVFEDAPSGVAAAKSAGILKGTRPWMEWIVNQGPVHKRNICHKVIGLKPVGGTLPPIVKTKDYVSVDGAPWFVIMVPDPRLSANCYGKTDQVLSSLLDFNPNQWGLPPFKNE